MANNDLYNRWNERQIRIYSNPYQDIESLTKWGEETGLINHDIIQNKLKLMGIKKRKTEEKDDALNNEQIKKRVKIQVNIIIISLLSYFIIVYFT